MKRMTIAALVLWIIFCSVALCYDSDSTIIIDSKQYELVDDSWAVLCQNELYNVENNLLTIYFDNEYTYEDLVIILDSLSININYVNRDTTWCELLNTSYMNVIDYYKYLDSLGIDNITIQNDPVLCYSPNDPLYSAYQQIYYSSPNNYHMEEVWDKVIDTEDIVVAIVETGIDISHPDLCDNIWINWGEDVNNDGVIDVNDNNGYDDDNNGYVDDFYGYNFYAENNNINSMDRSTYYDFANPYVYAEFAQANHGTHVAGLISAITGNNEGIAGFCGGNNVDCGGTRIMTCQITDNTGGEFLGQSDAYEAIEYAIDNGADIILLNFVTGETEEMNSLIDLAEEENIVVICPSGNRTSPIVPSTQQYPAVNMQTLAVSASATNNPDGLWESYSCLACNGVLALGQMHSTTMHDNTNYLSDYAVLRGTSIAAAQVVGLAAMLRAEYPDSDAVWIKKVIKRSSRLDVESITYGTYGPYSIQDGYGLIRPDLAILKPLPPSGANVVLQQLGPTSRHPYVTWSEPLYDGRRMGDIKYYRIRKKYYYNDLLQSEVVFDLPTNDGQNYIPEYIDSHYNLSIFDEWEEGECIEYYITAIDYTYQSSSYCVTKIGDVYAGDLVQIVNINQDWAGITAVVEDSLVVPDSVNLRLSSGTRLEFEKDAYMIIYGKLEVVGTDTSDIVFTSKIPGETWNGIIFEDSSIADMQYFSLNSVVDGLRINGTHGSSTIHDFVVRDASNIGLYMDEADDVTIFSAKIANCSTGLVAYATESVSLDTIDVDSCTIGIKFIQSDVNLAHSSSNYNTYDGVSLQNCSGNTISHCEAKFNGKAGFNLMASDPVIYRTVIKNNNENGLSLASSSDPVLGTATNPYFGNTFYSNGIPGKTLAQRAEIYCASSRPEFGGRHNDFVDNDAQYLFYDANYSKPVYDGSDNFWDGMSGKPQKDWTYPSSCIDPTGQDATANHPGDLNEIVLTLDDVLALEADGYFYDAIQGFATLLDEDPTAVAFDGWIRCQIKYGEDMETVLAAIEDYLDDDDLGTAAFWAKIRLLNKAQEYGTSIALLDTFILNSDNEIDSLQGILGQLNTYYEMSLANAGQGGVQKRTGDPEGRAAEASWQLAQIGMFEYPVPQNGSDFDTKQNNLLALLKGAAPEEETEILMPTEFSLQPAYPNPFNPSVTIPYALPQTTDISLTIHNVLGQQVAKLVTGHIQAGYHRVVWDGRSNAGLPVSSGVYFVTMKAGNFIKTQKIVMMK